MSSLGAALSAAVPTSNARAEASRRNGAKSRGPRTPAGKTRAAQNALKHGLRAAKHVVLLDEDWDEFRALERALLDELAPEGAVQAILVQRIAVATWRLGRADRLEVEVLAFRAYAGATPGLALIRDGNGTRSIETLLRYRAAALAELTRSLRTLQAEARAPASARAEAAPRRVERTRAQPAQREAPIALSAARPSKRSSAAGIEAPVRPRAVAPVTAAVRLDQSAARDRKPNEPEARGGPGESGPPRDRANPSDTAIERRPRPTLAPAATTAHIRHIAGTRCSSRRYLSMNLRQQPRVQTA